MKIVDRKTFLSLPANTLFCKYTTCGNFGDLEIKECNGEWGNDFVTSPILGWIDETDNSNDLVDKFVEYEKNGESFRIDLHCSGRDGLFDADQLFAVFDKQDVESLIFRLQGLIKETT